MVKKKTALQRAPRPSTFRSSIPAYLIAFIGAATAIVQGGTWAALTVFVAAMATAAAIEIFRR